MEVIGLLVDGVEARIGLGSRDRSYKPRFHKISQSVNDITVKVKIEGIHGVSPWLR